MKALLNKLSLVFTAGVIGGLINSIFVWFFGKMGIPALAGVNLAPQFTRPWLYQRMVWGGIWGFLLLLPFLRRKPDLRGLFLSLFPTLVQLFVVFPYQVQKGMMGLQLGTLTPLFVLFYNAIWGITAVCWMKAVNDLPAYDDGLQFLLQKERRNLPR